MNENNPVICAIDTRDIDFAVELAGKLKGNVAAIKLGLEFFTLFGVDGVKKVTQDGEIPLFLDLKFHDIPNTVAGAVKSAMHCNPFMMTVHASGGSDMIRAAVDATKGECEIIAVTILTSLNKGDLDEVGFSSYITEQVTKLAKLAKKSGANGCVCSGHELEDLSSVIDSPFTYVVPGIRFDRKNDDQKRVMTPKEAVDAGASYIVVGRQICRADDPVAEVKRILESIKN